jgi:hypothetical protein
MARQFGNLPPKYSFILNPHAGTRVSSCPICEKPTHTRKFAMMIHIDDFGLMTLGKTSRYCSPCQLIITHQNELEEEFEQLFRQKNPTIIGKPYLVLGTVDTKIWKEQLARPGGTGTLEDVLDHMADFKEVLDFQFTPQRWVQMTPAQIREYDREEAAKKERAKQKREQKKLG